MRVLSVSLMMSMCLASVVAAGCAVDPSAGEDGGEGEVASSEDQLRALLTSEIAGTLTYGQSVNVAYTYGPLYRAYRFEGAAGDVIRAKVSSPSGQPYVWLVDASSRTLATVRGAAGGVAVIEQSLAKTGTYYVVLRNRTRAAAPFTITLEGESASSGEEIPTSLPASEVNLSRTMQYGETAAGIVYTDASAAYHGISIRALEGDRLDIDVGGPDALALLVDPDRKVVASNQGASSAKLRARATKSGTYTVAFRHAYFEDASYTVAVNAAFAREGVDPFDPASCTGPALANADVAKRLPSPAAAPGETFKLGTHTVQARTRSCTGAGCGPWGAAFAPVIEDSASEGAMATLTPVKLVRAQNGAVNLTWEQPGCYASPRGATCQIAPDGAFTCDDYKGRFHYANTAWPGCREGVAHTRVGSSRVKVALAGSIRQHCARASSVVRVGTMDVEVVSLVQY